ncbi:PadR family transcriptional regulator [Mesorhizobium sp. AaZ16]
MEEKVGGAYSPSPGVVYPTLTLLEDIGHVRVTTDESARKLHEITPEGTEFLEPQPRGGRRALRANGGYPAGAGPERDAADRPRDREFQPRAQDAAQPSTIDQRAGQRHRRDHRSGGDGGRAELTVQGSRPAAGIAGPPAGRLAAARLSTSRAKSRLRPSARIGWLAFVRFATTVVEAGNRRWEIGRA